MLLKILIEYLRFNDNKTSNSCKHTNKMAQESSQLTSEIESAPSAPRRQHQQKNNFTHFHIPYALKTKTGFRKYIIRQKERLL
jgi:hypothetical protein